MRRSRDLLEKLLVTYLFPSEKLLQSSQEPAKSEVLHNIMYHTGISRWGSQKEGDH
jgi:hypothetical protein